MARKNASREQPTVASLKKDLKEMTERYMSVMDDVASAWGKVQKLESDLYTAQYDAKIEIRQLKLDQDLLREKLQTTRGEAAAYARQLGDMTDRFEACVAEANRNGLQLDQTREKLRKLQKKLPDNDVRDLDDLDEDY